MIFIFVRDIIAPIDSFYNRSGGAVMSYSVSGRLSAVLGVFVLFLFPELVFAETKDASMPEGLHLLSIDELVNIEVFSASKKPQTVSNTAAAIFVITQDDIRRSGATSIPEVLRMVPGLDVAQIDGGQWAITARGFNGVFGDKLLVLLDGRTIYTPFFGGVFWEVQDTMLEDIERIEVIRGPGATLWGANATNGVINIITKKASDTQGALFTGGGGSYEHGFGGMRYGGKEGDTDFRVYAKYFDRGANKLMAGGDAHDETEQVRGGFRTDTALGEQNLLTVQGDAYYNEAGWDLIERTPTGTVLGGTPVRRHNGANLLGRFTRTLAEESELQFQTYYDYEDRDDSVLGQRRDTLDVEVQHRVSPLEGHDLVYGAGYRFYKDEIDNTFSVSVDPDSRKIDFYTAFVQDEIALVEETLYLIGGVKLEKNAHSGWEVMPSARLLATPSPKHTFWAAVSRAVRSPARFNEDGRVLLDSFIDPSTGIPTVVAGLGDRRFDGENLLAYETGYRTQVADWLSIDLALFYNDYDDLESFEPEAPALVTDSAANTFIEVPFRIDNLLDGETYGAEFTLDLRPIEDWRIVCSYSLLEMNLSRTGGSQDTVYLAGEDQSPESQLHIRSLVNLPYDLEFDAAFRFISDIDTFNVDGYEELDLRLAWHVRNNLELAVVGQNLLDDKHLEFVSNLVNTERVGIKRGVYGKLTWTY